ncbi:Non-ribosomal peptide synthetase module [Granulibacter bethesdensis CGDNIH1]|uniref:Non-ribosomal peptide synthetase module n=2 Tax=Granulibacter bethesdensis TaxID=364410 RepID=Q0BVN1_GRABC|nr:Non-ribosomal peptide synthetase module [Granulibacter bethesdensis CGDNIH1]APH50895.1 Non-ribosomal peptide synthetase module [Granulibacter bethesdensis]APH58515.1 Non-ribosomal peptide synthetase module [Granulibacter bethesdensis]APH63590.1 Non-ribosomal peptide synthetase module [Granulibacter bethesdensis]
MNDMRDILAPVTPDHGSLADVFRVTAARLPEKIAIRFRGQAISYAELDALSSRWAAVLAARGIGPGRFVGIWITRSIALHAAILAVLKTGAAYLPFDPEAPRERVDISVEDCQAAAVLVDAAHLTLADGLSVPAITTDTLDETAPAIAPGADAFQPPASNDPAYAIYTSGSTGKPKGIAVCQSNIRHLLHSENAVLGIREDDIVYQGFSPAFDMSLEEVFISYLAGATLIVAPPELVRASDALPDVLTEENVTVLHCVPTLLAMLDRDVPSLRLINMGGEACPAALVDRWWKPGRRLLNTYGPTETTVTATAAELEPGDPITIGYPLPGYTAYILDETTLAPVPAGEGGELLIGGPGVSLGYIGRPELTAEKFIRNPLVAADASDIPDPVLYRTGDKASFDTEGRIVFHGRIDDQIKFRGYRIETGEIEAELGKLDAVRAAAVVLREDSAGTQHLVAFISYAEGATPDAGTIRTALAARLPAYMLPTVFLALDEIPRLPSGKINRKALPAVIETIAPEKRDIVAPRNPAEAALVEAAQAVFPHIQVSTIDDFFQDLGGHSLSAAGLVSRLRQDERFRSVSIQDLYECRTLDRLAAKFADTATGDTEAVLPPFQTVPPWRHRLCGAAQSVALIPIFGLQAIRDIVPYLVFSALMEFDWTLRQAILGTLLTFVLTPLVITAIAIAAKWLVIGRYKPGSYPLWGSYYFRWWFVSRMLQVVPAAFMADTPAYSIYCRLLGMKVGKDAHLGSVGFGAADLIEIGADTSIGNEVFLNNVSIEGGMLHIGHIRIGTDCYVGSRAVVERDAVMEDRAELGNLSALSADHTIPAGEIWNGSPASFTAKAAPETQPEHITPLRRVVFDTALSLVMAVFPVIAFVPLLPGMVIYDQLHDGRWSIGTVPLYALIPLLSVMYISFMLAEIVILRWLLLGRVKEGVYDVRSAFFLRKWFVDHLMELALGAVHAIYATLYVVPWMRALGAKIGEYTEISTATSVTHDLLDIGPEAFIADGVMLGDADIRHGRLYLRKTVIGRRSFVGNSALLPDGTSIPDECLVGCLSVPPATDKAPLKDGQTCLGSPSFILPTRQSFTCHAETLTFRPGPIRIGMRLLIEGIRVLLPPALFIAMLGHAMTCFDWTYDHYGLLASYAAVPFIYFAVMGIPSLLSVALMKWVLIGRYQSAEVPMWTPFVWLSEAITATYEGLAVPFLLDPFRGTPFLPWSWKLLGAKVGRRICADTTDLTEFDMVEIGDDAALDTNCGPQTHLFEDRVMKIGLVRLGARTSLGTMSIALYGSTVNEDARIGPLSLVMKGESIPAGTVWSGSPARRQS